jgi:hypothetical protein
MLNLGGRRFCDNTAPYRLGYSCCQERRPQYSLDPVFDQCLVSSCISCAHQLKDVDTFVSDTDNTFIDGIGPRVMSTLDLHVPDSAPTHYADVGDHQVKAIFTASVGVRNPMRLGLCSSRETY